MLNCKFFLAQFNDTRGKKRSISQSIFEVFRHLMNQSMNKKPNQDWMFTFWSFMSLIITITFAGGVLSSIVNKQYLPINNIRELIHSNIPLIHRYQSWIWWQYYNNKYRGQELDELLAKLQPRLKDVNNSVFEGKV